MLCYWYLWNPNRLCCSSSLFLYFVSALLTWYRELVSIRLELLVASVIEFSKSLGLCLVCLSKIDYIDVIWFSDLLFWLFFYWLYVVFVWVCGIIDDFSELFAIRFVHVEGRFGNLEFAKQLIHVTINWYCKRLKFRNLWVWLIFPSKCFLAFYVECWSWTREAFFSHVRLPSFFLAFGFVLSVWFQLVLFGFFGWSSLRWYNDLSLWFIILWVLCSVGLIFLGLFIWVMVCFFVFLFG